MSRPGLTADARRVLAAQALRAFAYGFGSVLLGVTLDERGFSSTEAGLIIAAVVAGTVAGVAGRRPVRRPRRPTTLLRGPLPAPRVRGRRVRGVEHAVVADRVRTHRCTVDRGGRVGPLHLARAVDARDRAERRRAGARASASTTRSHPPRDHWGPSRRAGCHCSTTGGPTRPPTAAFFLVFVPVALAGAAVAASLTEGIEVTPPQPPEPQSHAGPRLGPSRPIVVRLAALFALDSFGGGFVVQAFIAYWLAQRFGASLGRRRRRVLRGRRAADRVVPRRATPRASDSACCTRWCSPTCRRTCCWPRSRSHPTLPVAVGLLLARTALSQMDVPTRQAYVMALVDTRRTHAGGRVHQHRPLRRPPDRPRARGSGAVHRARAAVPDRRLDQGHLRPDPVAMVLPRRRPRRRTAESAVLMTEAS